MRRLEYVRGNPVPRERGLVQLFRGIQVFKSEGESDQMAWGNPIHKEKGIKIIKLVKHTVLYKLWQFLRLRKNIFQVKWYKDSNLLSESSTVSFTSSQERHTLILR
jgi:hypothetical protein